MQQTPHGKHIWAQGTSEEDTEPDDLAAADTPTDTASKRNYSKNRNLYEIPEETSRRHGDVLSTSRAEHRHDMACRLSDLAPHSEPDDLAAADTPTGPPALPLPGTPVLMQHVPEMGFHIAATQRLQPWAIPLQQTDHGKHILAQGASKGHTKRREARRPRGASMSSSARRRECIMCEVAVLLCIDLALPYHTPDLRYSFWNFDMSVLSLEVLSACVTRSTQGDQWNLVRDGSEDKCQPQTSRQHRAISHCAHHGQRRQGKRSARELWRQRVRRRELRSEAVEMQQAFPTQLQSTEALAVRRPGWRLGALSLFLNGRLQATAF